MPNLSKTAALIAGGALVVLAGAAVAQQDFVRNTETDNRACFETRKMEGYAPATVGQRDAINIRVSLDGVYQLEFSTICPGLKEATGVAIRTKNGSRLLCTGGEAELAVRGALAGPASCSVSGVRKLTEAEVAALPARARP